MKKTENFKQFFKLLKFMQGVEKEDLVWQYSNTLTTSLREFYANNPQGYQRMITDMERVVQGYEQNIKKLRSGVLHRLQKLGIDTTNWQHVNTFLCDRRIAGKMLYELQTEELQFLITKLENILTKQAQKSQELTRLKQMN